MATCESQPLVSPPSPLYISIGNQANPQGKRRGRGVGEGSPLSVVTDYIISNKFILIFNK